MTSKISLSCVPARIRSAFQQTLRMERPETGTRNHQCVQHQKLIPTKLKMKMRASTNSSVVGTT